MLPDYKGPSMITAKRLLQQAFSSTMQTSEKSLAQKTLTRLNVYMPTTMSARETTKTKHYLFAHYFVNENMSATRAYSKVYAVDPGSKSTRNSASRLLANDGVKTYIHSMRLHYLERAKEAFEAQWNLAQQSTTPPEVKNLIYDSVQDRAGLGSRKHHGRRVRQSILQSTSLPNV